MSNLIAFEIKNQIKSLTFIAIALLFVSFLFSMTSEIFNYPVRTQQDIDSLIKKDKKEYLHIGRKKICMP